MKRNADEFKKTALDWERRFEIVVGTAEGLSYLHSGSEVRIIHRDIKAGNILLDERFRVQTEDRRLRPRQELHGRPEPSQHRPRRNFVSAIEKYF